MRGREIPPAAGWIAAAIAVVVAGYFLWNTGAPRTEPGGQANARDKELLRRMGEARDQAGGGGRGAAASQQPQTK